MIAVIWIGLVAIVLAVAVVGWINLRRHGESTHAQAGWRWTDESFRDPSTGRLMRVWLDPVDGSRHYVSEEAGGA